MRHHRWLNDELPALVADGVLDPNTAERLRARYPVDGGPDLWRRVALVVFGVLGATLIGAGLILLVAHNWDDLSKPARAGVAMGLTVFGQAAVGFTLWRRRDDAAWQEGSATLLVLCVGATLALVSQTYHLDGELHAFLFSWLLLAVPVVWLVPSRMAASLVVWGATFWATAQPRSDLTLAWLVWVGTLVPFLVGLWRQPSAPRRDHLVWWSLVLGALAMTAELGHEVRPYELLAFASVLGGLNGLGHLAPAQQPVTRAARWAGLFGTVAMGLVLTWEEGWSVPGGWPRGDHWVLPAVCFALCGLASLGAAGRLLQSGRLEHAARAALVAWVGLGVLLTGALGGGVGALLANVVVFLASLGVMVRGVRANELGRTNGGLAVLSLLLLFRFFDGSVSFIVRGVVFVLLGLGFLGLNLYLLRHRDPVTP